MLDESLSTSCLRKTFCLRHEQPKQCNVTMKNFTPFRELQVHRILYTVESRGMRNLSAKSVTTHGISSIIDILGTKQLTFCLRIQSL